MFRIRTHAQTNEQTDNRMMNGVSHSVPSILRHPSLGTITGTECKGNATYLPPSRRKKGEANERQEGKHGLHFVRGEEGSIVSWEE